MENRLDFPDDDPVRGLASTVFGIKYLFP